ncbi:hypothetical protein [Actinosynnema mirum]|uniref:hypothetical protein n=1 Tax=Actinosynnema mirum TaxID=40567 RepID=UPI0002DC0B13|nr:hypothetical protein [Actinosynnema mirum]
MDWKPCADVAAGWDPDDRTIDLAGSRLRATERAVVLNPGGPASRASRCPGTSGRAAPPDVEPGRFPSTKDEARSLAEADAARNRECAAGVVAQPRAARAAARGGHEPAAAGRATPRSRRRRTRGPSGCAR